MTKSKNPELLNNLEKAARTGGISKREFLQYSMLAGVTASTATGLWTSQAKAQPKRGGTFRYGVHDGNTSDNHDPGTYQSVYSIQLAHTHRSYLTEITEENGLGPDMATGWEASPDAKVWTFELNTDAVFHDGRKFTANDAVASLNHHRGEKSTSAAKALLDSVVDIKVDGDKHIVIELDQGFADLPWIMTDYHLVMLPAKDDGSVDWESGVGAGPYKIEQNEFGIGTTLVRHDGWHREGAWFDRIDMTVLNDPNARQTALVTGDVDAISSVDLKTMALLQRHPDVELDNIPSGSAITLPMFCDVAPFDNVDVRMALKLAIDREEIVEKIVFGTGTPGNDFHVSPNMPYFPADIPQRTYDPEKAKWHLKQAGVDNLSVSLSAADSVLPGAVDMIVLYSEQAKKAGIDIKPVREANDGYWSDVWLKKPWVFVKWGARPTPDNMFTLAYKDDAAWNEAHWKNARFNELLLQAKAELDETRRGEMYHEMCTLARDDGGTIIPMFVNFVYARRKNVKHGPSVASSWETDGARGTHRWWFEG
ncbi:MAG: ABC transporter substrate-binding protein [Roseibium album]|nr:ABC transporter substrate-binding protein [Roseibium album]MBG6161698.1 peptide/nickel transport system substrate-binding protein [Labrenzia sp. EL_195]MBG6175287.1 peptide/nickel transport system substrate-binding protein [Labrenzia sp. EL_132]MBG6199824.1 peptide/nickel transport system substrate-binding protein [Labrenzia sp. EL_13]MBG6229899.1 peptide/nickel transport system substrate-binding protein [Labrenzia sp. EL_208]